jgi:hypothetical protein
MPILADLEIAKLSSGPAGFLHLPEKAVRYGRSKQRSAVSVRTSQQKIVLLWQSLSGHNQPKRTLCCIVLMED